LNGKLDPDEMAVLWFDLKNVSRVTAGVVQVTITVNDPYVQFFTPLNIGAISETETQIRYGKVNGLDIAAALPFVGNSYFQTNPFFSQDWATGVWVRVDASAPRGRVVNFRVRAEPSNGDPAFSGSVAEKDFPVVIN
jgi:hypothetical protein